MVFLSSLSTSLHLQAKELEVITHAHVKVIVTPRWSQGKTHQYQSALPGSGDVVVSVAQQVEERGPINQELGNSDTVTPKTTRPIIPIQDSNSCRVCGGGNGEGKEHWWVGCGGGGGKARCQHWVHQKCIGLRCTAKSQIKNIPYHCPKHV